MADTPLLDWEKLRPDVSDGVCSLILQSLYHNTSSAWWDCGVMNCVLLLGVLRLMERAKTMADRGRRTFFPNISINLNEYRMPPTPVFLLPLFVCVRWLCPVLYNEAKERFFRLPVLVAGSLSYTGSNIVCGVANGSLLTSHSGQPTSHSGLGCARK